MEGLARGAVIGMVMDVKMKSRGLALLGGFTSCVVGFTIGRIAGNTRNLQQAMETGQFDANFPAGGLKECLKASITGIPPDPAEMEQYLQQPHGTREWSKSLLSEVIRYKATMYKERAKKRFELKIYILLVFNY